jgi:hypothetical protein
MAATAAHRLSGGHEPRRHDFAIPSMPHGALSRELVKASYSIRNILLSGYGNVHGFELEVSNQMIRDMGLQNYAPMGATMIPNAIWTRADLSVAGNAGDLCIELKILCIKYSALKILCISALCSVDTFSCMGHAVKRRCCYTTTYAWNIDAASNMEHKHSASVTRGTDAPESR